MSLRTMAAPRQKEMNDSMTVLATTTRVAVERSLDKTLSSSDHVVYRIMMSFL